MDDCIEKCCQSEKCDLAMFKADKCYVVGCPSDVSCQITHSEDAEADITFITDRKKPEKNGR